MAKETKNRRVLIDKQVSERNEARNSAEGWVRCLKEGVEAKVEVYS